MKRFLLLPLLLVLLVSFSTSVFAATKADFVFAIDATGSMAGEISAVKDGLGNFVTGLDAAAVDYRFSVVLFGGYPELVMDWTTSATQTEAAFDTISVNGSVSGFQNNHNVNPEAGLEAIRIILGEASNNTLRRDNVGGSGGLSYRADARKNIILVTDEDSDLPFYSENRYGNQADPQNVLSDQSPEKFSSGWQEEVDATADAVINQQAFVNLLINDNDWPSQYQYGDPDQDVSDADLLNFDPTATYNNLVAAGYGNSLEAQVLEAGLIGRAFDIGQVNDASFINNFYAAKIEEIVTNPVTPVPEPTTMLLMGTGLFGLAGVRRKLKK